MTTPLHPDQLEVGHHVGPWRIVGTLGAGGFGRVFKVERGGHVYALKLALRPANQHASDEEDVNGRIAREVAALLACAPHPNLPRVHAVDRWPEPPDGYLFHVTDFVDGETFHEWRWRVKPSAAHLLTVYTEVVRVVADLHRRGVHHRDLKSDNLLIRRLDERPILIDLGTARIPGASTLTVGVAPASPHLLPPECVTFLREGSWKAGANFDAGIPGDLYALGALLYESLTDGYAFDPRLPYERLLPAIETVVPRAPKDINPKVPSSLSDIAMRLLSKRPEDRYSGTETLLQALWDAAKDKRHADWKVSLDVPADPDASGLDRGVVSLSQFPGGATALTAQARESAPAEPSSPAEAVEPKRRRRSGAVLGLGVLLLGFLIFGLARLTPDRPPPVVAPVSEKGSSSVTPTPSLPDAAVLAVASSPDAGVSAAVEPTPSVPPEAASALAKPPRGDGGVMRKVAGAAVAACVGMSCAGGSANTRNLEGEPCPAGAKEAMRALKNAGRANMSYVYLRESENGYMSLRDQEPIQGIIHYDGHAPGELPGRSIMRGRAVFEPGFTRLLFTEATLPGGKVVPICMEYQDSNTRQYGFPQAQSNYPEDTATVRHTPIRLFYVVGVGRLLRPNED
ncbi:protein kinase [Corallococcus exiguus]|uniref:serine/threonine protein kinase n=1 Tax=Corallococcus TaxID=83461 RepID=UPI000ED4F001|nr:MULTISPECIES: serine/threonine-protein kinase [Corallococcus]NNB89119.1 protein kinase [Corallococcus exiguus]NNB97449.1 protein kinase [Corallococcus exiguus]NNC06316.1 protein kinase [Corallococcus exiguus]NPC48539.1 protein kinase [Corallococcus exiguus]RKH80465.1 serine/threonine protein kinase [Corallococcus sp. AB032C]